MKTQILAAALAQEFNKQLPSDAKKIRCSGCPFSSTRAATQSHFCLDSIFLAARFELGSTGVRAWMLPTVCALRRTSTPFWLRLKASQRHHIPSVEAHRIVAGGQKQLTWLLTNSNLSKLVEIKLIKLATNRQELKNLSTLLFILNLTKSNEQVKVSIFKSQDHLE